MATTPQTVNRPRAVGSGIDALLLAAPAAAVAASVAAEWLDFRALRYALLLMVAFGVLTTARAMFRGHTGWRANWRALAMTILLGIGTWAAAETLYVVLHVAQGERFSFDRFDSQPARAVGLIGVHALFLGLPTGLVAGVALYVLARVRDR